MNIFIPLKRTCVIYVKSEKSKVTNNKAFFEIPSDDGTVRYFLDAIIKNNLEDAKTYLSKNFIDKIDLDAVTEVFSKGKICKRITKNEFGRKSKIFKTNSVLVMENGISMVLHLHMIQEPDKNGNWKIFGIEKE